MELNKRKNLLKQAPLAILGAIVIGAVGSGVWDLIAKPGITVLGRSVLNIVTLGSKTLYNSAYSTAALNPTSLPSLLIVLAIINIPLLITVYVFYEEFVHPSRKKKIENTIYDITKGQDSITDEQKELIKVELILRRKKNRNLAIVIIICCLSIYLLFYAGSKVLNQSILIYRVFNANIEIIAPYTSSDEIKQLRSKFSQITTKEDFSKIESRIIEIAKESKLTLRSEKLW